MSAALFSQIRYAIFVQMLGTAVQGSKVLVMEAAAANIGDRSIVCDFNYDFQPRERLGLVGPNGSGAFAIPRTISSRNSGKFRHRCVKCLSSVVSQTAPCISLAYVTQDAAGGLLCSLGVLSR